MSANVHTVEAGLLQPVDRFDLACTRVVDYLNDAVPMGMWAVTRVESDTSTLLVVRDTAYGVRPGTSLPFQALPCSRMVDGTGPVIAPDTNDVPAYASSGFAQTAPLGAYLGIPVTTDTGRLFGTICGYDPEPKPPALYDARPLLDLVGMLLSAVLTADRAATEHRRLAELSSLEAETDPLTGLLNRRAWTRHLRNEDPRYRRFGDLAVVVMVDLDGLKAINDNRGHAAGDQYLRRAADAMRAVVRPVDFLARLGGDEFGLVLPGLDATGAGNVVDRLAASFDAYGVAASIGWAPVDASQGTSEACALADERMYEAKRERRTRAA